MVARSAAIYLGVVQFFFASTWTIYVIYLPQLVNQAGLPRSWVPWILVADQIVFALADVATGFWIDRVRAGLARIGGWILGISAVSYAAFLLLPLLGAGAQPLIVLIAVWAVTSSALRSPAWVLIARYAAKPSMPWVSVLVLTGNAVAAALAPYLGVALKGVDPRLPFALSSLTLLGTVGGILMVERRLAATTPVGESEPAFDWNASGALGTVATFFVCVFVAALGFQAVFALNAAPQYLRFAKPDALPYLLPVFWIGFNLLMFPAAAIVKRAGWLPVMAGSALAGSAAAAASSAAPDLHLLIAAQFLNGGCWGAMTVAAFCAATAFGRVQREGALLGTLFAVLAAATLARILVVAGGLPQMAFYRDIAVWLPALCWVFVALAFTGIRAIIPAARSAGG